MPKSLLLVPSLLAVSLFAQPLCAAEPAVELAFVNDDYRDLGGELAPIEQGGMTVWVTSPRHRLTVHRNRLVLVPLGAGEARGEMMVDLDGEGDLEAEVESLGTRTRFADRVVVPRQTVTVAGRVRIARLAEGYELTLLELPETVRLRIESGVAGQVVGACETLDALPLVSLPCAALATSFATADVALPATGERFFLAAEELTAEERAYLDRVAAP